MDRPPHPRAPRLGPRAFSIGLVNSFEGNFVWVAQLRKQTLLRLSTNDCYADKQTLGFPPLLTQHLLKFAAMIVWHRRIFR